MKFKDFDKEQRIYESQIADTPIMNDMYIIVRLDGKGFTKLTNEHFNKPFDSCFSSMMVSTMNFLIQNSGFKIIYGYTQSDEISLVLSLKDDTFNRKPRKILSILAGLASSYFSLEMTKQTTADKIICVFDARISLRPTIDSVAEYLLWRMTDASRNSLNTACYWSLRNKGLSARKATSILSHKPDEYESDYDYKINLLKENNVDYNEIANNFKYGAIFYSILDDHEGYNPKTNEHVTTKKAVFRLIPANKSCIDLRYLRDMLVISEGSINYKTMDETQHMAFSVIMKTLRIKELGYDI